MISSSAPALACHQPGATASPIEQKWRPILTGSQAEEALETVRAVAADVKAWGASVWKWDAELRFPYSLAFGEAGFALFFGYLSKSFAQTEDLETTSLFLEHLEVALRTEMLPFNFLTGISGIYWVMQHLSTHLGLQIGPQCSLSNANDAALLEYCDRKDMPLSFSDGLSGILVYAAERIRSDECRQLALRAALRIREAGDLYGGGIAWPLSEQITLQLRSLLPEVKRPPKLYSTTVGHGVAGILGALLLCYRSGLREAWVSELISEAVEWLLMHKSCSGSSRQFPVVVGIETPLPFTADGWYMGDIGTIGTLFNAAVLFAREDWKSIAFEAARTDARRRLSNTLGDFSLSTGCTGFAHFYHRFFQMTEDEVFAEAAKRMYIQAIHAGKSGREITGKFSVDGKNLRGVLAGSAGVALTVLAGISSTEPAWDRAFLFT